MGTQGNGLWRLVTIYPITYSLFCSTFKQSQGNRIVQYEWGLIKNLMSGPQIGCRQRGLTRITFGHFLLFLKYFLIFGHARHESHMASLIGAFAVTSAFRWVTVAGGAHSLLQRQFHLKPQA